MIYAYLDGDNLVMAKSRKDALEAMSQGKQAFSLFPLSESTLPMRVLAKCEDWTTRTEILRSCRDTKAADLEHVIASLVEAKLLQVRPTPNKLGRKSKEYRRT